MHNPYQTTTVKILKIEDEGSRSKLFTLEAPRDFTVRSGQFVEISLPGYGEAPISLCSDPSVKNKFELCVRKAGMVTGALHALKVGDKVGVRGPYGRPFPAEIGKQRNLLLVAGGLGLEPLRPAIWEIMKNREQYKKVQIFYGACDENDLLFTKDYDELKKKIDLHITLDKPKGLQTPVACGTGVVTTLFDHVKLYENPVAFLCGPPVMYKFVIKKLKELAFLDSDIYLSLERRMHCGVGVCNHCAVGSFFVCQDGPVFSWAELKDIKGAI
ncbi:FAD/NAD(P)-binding protein [Candidatus Falkowbacteria bacterium]|nr:FAD/NAD(P)-binding protein [Candidatus Falkowbacteria bacterium]